MSGDWIILPREIGERLEGRILKSQLHGWLTWSNSGVKYYYPLGRSGPHEDTLKVDNGQYLMNVSDLHLLEEINEQP